jgi:hypothetical protein
MGKTLRVLIYIMFPLMIFIVTLDVLLFQKREMLKGRTQKLENTIVALGTTIEANRATVPVKPDYASRDADDCTSQIIETPRRSDFWETYSHQLEIQEVPKLNLNLRRDEMKSYYKFDEMSGKAIKDEMGRKITAGVGTTDGVLKNVLGQAEDQLALLKDTRKQLVVIREELVDTITEKNQRKTALRESLNTIVQRERTIAQLDDRTRGLENKIDELKDEIRSLQDTIGDQKTQIEEKNKEIEDTEHDIKRLVAEIERRTRGTATAVTDLIRMPTGYKGKVMTVNDDWSFVLIELTDQFLSELTADPAKGVPNLELIIKRRSGDDFQFVTKIKLNHIRAGERVGVADVLTNWLQMPIEVGDAVFLGS